MGQSESIRDMGATQPKPEEDAGNFIESLEMARRIKAHQGNHEAEVTCGGEADLLREKRSCKKNPGHHSFIPVNDFKMHHLPHHYRDDNLYSFIKTHADLTVRVCVSHNSVARPDSYSQMEGGSSSVCDKPFSLRGHISPSFLKTGTGWVYFVARKSAEAGDGWCSCRGCKSSATPQHLWGEVHVLTAQHMLVDTDEACSTTCDLFYNTDDHEGVRSIEGVRVDESDSEGDRSRFTCVTHDLELIDLLEELCRRRKRLRGKVFDKYDRSPFDAHAENINANDNDDDNNNNNNNNNNDDELSNNSSSSNNILAVIVSQPHGCAKQISIGSWVDSTIHEDLCHQYTTATCPGSSGAHVCALGRNRWLNSIHSCSTGTPGVNMCGGWYSFDRLLQQVNEHSMPTRCHSHETDPNVA